MCSFSSSSQRYGVYWYHHADVPEESEVVLMSPTFACRNMCEGTTPVCHGMWARLQAWIRTRCTRIQTSCQSPIALAICRANTAEHCASMLKLASATSALTRVASLTKDNTVVSAWMVCWPRHENGRTKMGGALTCHTHAHHVNQGLIQVGCRKGLLLQPTLAMLRSVAK
jgi:hypothetical protein